MKKIYFIAALLATTMSFSQVFTATYDFAGIPSSATNGTTDPTTPPSVPGLTFGAFTASNPGTPTTFNGSSGAGRFSYPNQPVGATNGDNTTFTSALDPAIYYQVTITPNPGTNFNLTGITFAMRRSGTGSRHYSVRSSADGYATNLPASINNGNTNLSVTNNIFFWTLDATANNADQLGSAITLNGASFTGLTSPITFRIYSWDAEASTGTFSVDNVAISGNVTTLDVTQNNIEGLKIYPNPAKNTLYVTSDSFASKQVELFDVLGKSVLNTKVVNNTVNISSLSKGVYVAKITEEGKTATRKIVIE